MRLRLVSLLLLAVASMHAAHAQTAPPPQDNSIIVTGKKQKPEKQAERFVQQVIDRGDLQLSRFNDPVCVHVDGLMPALNEGIGDRFRAVAEATGAPVAPAGCEPNVLVLVVDDTKAFLKLARKKYHKRFKQLTDIDLRNALRDGPVRAWRTIVTIDEIGKMVPTTRIRMISNPRTDPLNESAMDIPAAYDPRTHAETVNAVIVIEKAVTVGKSAMQIADYAAMRTLSGAKPPAKGAIASTSILSLFGPAGQAAPKEISDMDLGLLGSLYALKNPTGNADVEIARMSKQMVSEKAAVRKAD